MKKLYIMRHGIALDIGEQGIRRDFDRPLSEEGRRKIIAAAQGLKALGHCPDVIGSSPLIRAWQTAECVQEVCACAAGLEECVFMAPGGSFTDLIGWVNAQPASARLMLVGHMPDVAWLTYACLDEKERQPLAFKKAAVACVVFDGRACEGRGRLEWFHPPRLLREAGMNK